MELSEVLKDSGLSVETLLKNSIKLLIEDVNVNSSFEAVAMEKRLNSILAYLSIAPQISSHDASDLVTKACVPCLMKLSLREETDKLVIQCVSKLIVLLLQRCLHQTRLDMFSQLLLLAKATDIAVQGPLSGEKQDRRAMVDIRVLIHVLSLVFAQLDVSLLEADKESYHVSSQLFCCLLSYIQHADKTLCYQLCSSVLPYFIVSATDGFSRLTSLWHLVVDARQNKVNIEMNAHDLALTILCCFVDQFLGPSHGNETSMLLDLKTSSIFWSVIQDGLGHSDPLSRKRSLFLLQHSLKSVFSSQTSGDFATPEHMFWWKKQYGTELKTIWEATVLLLETLEEKQVHIVKPVMTRLKVLIDATQTPIEGYRLLHFSWLCVVVKRAFVHESKTIIKWAVTDFLTMPMDNSPLKQQEFWPVCEVFYQFLFNDLLSILSDSFLYTRELDAALGSCSSISSLFIEFTTSLVQSIPDDSKGEFLVRFMEAITEHKMADVPLVFITYALSKIPAQPVVAGEFLAIVRELILTCLDTHSIPMRAAIQCFLLTTIINLSKEKELAYHDITATLGVFKAKECLLFDSIAWKQASEWLVRVTKHIEDGIVELLRSTIKGVIKNTKDDKFKIDHVARLLLLFFYSVSQDGSFFNYIAEKEAATTTKELIENLISPVLDVIVKAHTHPYLSKTTVNNALELLVLILRELPGTITPLGSLLYHAIEPWIQDILLYVQRELLIGSRFSPFPDLVYLKFFLDAWDILWLLLEVNSSPARNSVCMQMESRCCAELDKVAETKELFLVSSLHGAMSVASWLCKKKTNAAGRDPLLCCLSQLVVEVELLKPSTAQVQNGNEFEDSHGKRMEEINKEWGHIVSHYLRCHWECVLCYRSLIAPLDHSSTAQLSSFTLCFIDNIQLAKVCISSLDTGSNDIIVTVCNCMALLVPELYQVSRDDLYNHIPMLWKLTLEFKNKRKIFSDALNAFLSFAFHPSLLVTCSSSDEQLCEILLQVIVECQEIGEQKTGMFNVLVSHCCRMWLKAIDEYSTSLQTSLMCYSNFIKDALLFGPVYKRNLRVPHDVNCFIEALGDECSSNSLHLRPVEGDAHVRLTVTLFLVQLAEKSKCNFQLGWVTQVFVPHLVQLLLQKSNEETSGRPKCFINSLSHRIRSRLWQPIVILLPYMEQPTLKDMLPAVFKAMECGDQFSVRYLQEWVVSYTLAVHPNLLPLLWERLENNTPNKFCLLVSVLTITAQVGRCFDNDNHDFLVKALPLVMKWTNCHHFMTKIYAQSVLLYLWDLYLAYNRIDQKLNHLYPIVEFIKMNGDITRCRKRMKENLFYTLCHAVNDLSFEGVYYIIPQSSQLTNDELISTEDFRLSELFNDSLLVSLRCSNRSLCEAAAKEEEERQSKAATDKSNPGVSDDVQKKITPWSSSSDTIMNELFPNQSDHPITSTKKPAGGELILVASLLHKPPNLGGLCRTCEIFGVSQLVLNSLNIIQDNQFQALSVSAEKWVPITEVKASNLVEYFRNIKQQGYSLIGVEQTTQSKCLTCYTFPLKTVLLLGNEREGIPVHLIHMLDECVEIPQLGIIRSLNVHISGALLIWEYTKQHSFKTTECT